MKNLARFRANIFMQRGAVAGAFRAIPFKILSFEELGLPPVIAEHHEPASAASCWSPGPTGSGKSTTLAAMIDKINSETRQHIMTIEDPIEYLHPHKLCLVNQREVHADTHGFKDALKSVLRQDPDIVLVGEMRDLETIEAALTIAETGHLVFATLHTNTAVGSINRIIDVFPPHQQSQIRAQLSFMLQAVVTQTLVPTRRRPGTRADPGDHGAQRRDSKPDPRGQGPPDLLDHADRPGRERHADHEPGAARGLHEDDRSSLEDALARSPDANELQQHDRARRPTAEPSRECRANA